MINELHITAIIPARNEALAIAHVIQCLRDLKHASSPVIDRILVIDNASTDDTAKVSEQSGAMVIGEIVQGYGAACYKGIQALSDTNIVLFVDGDFTYRSTDIKRVILNLIEYELDLVMGSRFLGQIQPDSMTAWQMIGTQLVCRIINWRFDFHFSDLGSLRAIRMDKLVQMDMQDRRYGWTAEMQIKALQNNLLMLELPVICYPRIGKSKISGTIKGTVLAAFDLLKTALFR